MNRPNRKTHYSLRVLFMRGECSEPRFFFTAKLLPIIVPTHGAVKHHRSRPLPSAATRLSPSPWRLLPSAHRGRRQRSLSSPPERPAIAFSTGPVLSFSIGAASFAPLASFTLVNFTHRWTSIPKQQGDLHSQAPSQQGDVALKAHVANICFKCFRGMLQVFRTGVAKVD
jgi:hypothetical protein